MKNQMMQTMAMGDIVRGMGATVRGMGARVRYHWELLSMVNHSTAKI